MVDTQEKPKAIAADLDGWVATYQNWKPTNWIGYPIEANINKMRSYKVDNPKDKIIVVLKKIDPTDKNIRPHTLSERIDEIRNWLTKSRVLYDELWTKPYDPEVSEWWTVKVREDE